MSFFPLPLDMGISAKTLSIEDKEQGWGLLKLRSLIYP